MVRIGSLLLVQVGIVIWMSICTQKFHWIISEWGTAKGVVAFIQILLEGVILGILIESSVLERRTAVVEIYWVGGLFLLPYLQVLDWQPGAYLAAFGCTILIAGLLSVATASFVGNRV